MQEALQQQPDYFSNTYVELLIVAEHHTKTFVASYHTREPTYRTSPGCPVMQDKEAKQPEKQ